MSKRPKKSSRVFILGFVLGFILTGLSAKFAYKYYRYQKTPQRYAPQYPFAEGQRPGFPDKTQVFVAASLDRVFQDGKTLLPPDIQSEARISAAANEEESFQIIVATGMSSLNNVTLKVGNFTLMHDDGVISSDQVRVSRVGFVPTAKPYYPVKFVGLWPDPLLPLKSGAIPPFTYQPFWVTIDVPDNVLPGEYQGAITVAADELDPVTIPVSLKVYAFRLRNESQLQTAFDLYAHETYKRYPQYDKESQEAYIERLNEINEKFLIMMMRYRMNPLLNIDPTVPEEMAQVDTLRAHGLNKFTVGKRGGTLGNNWPRSPNEIEGLLGEYRTYGEILNLNQMLDLAYLYTWDEGRIGEPVVAMICDMIHRAYPGLKNMVAYHGFWDPDENPQWGKDIDIWAFQIDNFNEPALRKMQAAGIEMWLYPSGPSGLKTPNLSLDFDSIDYRIIPWLCWKYDIKGILYWCVNWWPYADPFQSAKNTKWEQNGNGLLFYPGPNGPLPSLRAEVFRDGMEDYEYIQELMRRLKTIGRSLEKDPRLAEFFDQSIGILTVDETIASSMEGYTRDGKVLKARRDTIAVQIERFDREIVPLLKKL